ncbi:putative eyespot globule-associated protein 1, partial [Haematococcus lacustris]
MMAEAISTLADMNFAEGHLQLAEDNVRVAMRSAEEAKEWVLAVKLANNLGAVLKKANKRPELLALHQSTWETAVDKLGIAHPFALVARANLVEALEEGGDAAGAKQLLQEVLDKLLSGEADQVKVVEGLGLDPHPAPIN